jgi:L-alanine-DL-glutamate epimerase-like enolase superfamily enzyme
MADLTIREIRTSLLRMPWADDPWMKGHALGPQRDLVVVEVVTASGLTGMGYLHLLNLPLQRTIGACIEEALAPRVIGRDATAVEAIWRDLWRATLTGGRGGVATMAQSAIDIALWDVVGKAAGLCTGSGAISAARSRSMAAAASAARWARGWRPRRSGTSSRATRPSRCRPRTSATGGRMCATCAWCATRWGRMSTS